MCQKAQSLNFMDSHFQDFFSEYHTLLHADDYVTQRQALKLLGEVLLDKAFMRVMLRYICNAHYMQIYMNLLRHDSRAIQIDAFHIFKVFVANPSKPPRVQQIIYRNKERLIKLLATFQNRKTADRLVTQDLETVIAVIQALDISPRAAYPPLAGGAADSHQGILVA